MSINTQAHVCRKVCKLWSRISPFTIKRTIRIDLSEIMAALIKNRIKPESSDNSTQVDPTTNLTQEEQTRLNQPAGSYLPYQR